MQQEIVAEIEGYQKVIDGARAVVENYRPHIHVDPDWPMALLKTLRDVKISKQTERRAPFHITERLESRLLDN